MRAAEPPRALRARSIVALVVAAASAASALVYGAATFAETSAIVWTLVSDVLLLGTSASVAADLRARSGRRLPVAGVVAGAIALTAATTLAQSVSVAFNFAEDDTHGAAVPGWLREIAVGSLVALLLGVLAVLVVSAVSTFSAARAGSAPPASDRGDRPLTEPGSARWGPTPRGFRRSERSAEFRTDRPPEVLADALLRWAVKTRSGFEVPTSGPAVAGQRLDVIVRLGPIRIVEPVEVVAVVREEGLAALAYATRPGHPVDGEEAFILRWSGDRVELIVRSLTRPSRSPGWRVAFPLLLVAQRVVRRRYLRSLR